MIEIRNLSVIFGQGRNAFPALCGVSLRVERGESFGIVGESGSGKSTLLRAIASLTTGWSGEIRVDGTSLSSNKTNVLPRILQMVFQDPYASLHPRQTVDHAIREAVAIHRLASGDSLILDALKSAGLDARLRFRYPHELSGGERQRAAIARALILCPRILLLDEPTSALDVSVQAEVVNLLMRLRAQRGMTYLMVSHDLPLIAHMCGRCAVMRAGQIIEELTAEDLRAGRAKDSFTRELIAASRGFKAA